MSRMPARHTGGSFYNQLAVLASAKGLLVATVYLYFRSITAPKPFTGAPDNLQQALQRVKEKYDQVIADSQSRDAQVMSQALC